MGRYSNIQTQKREQFKGAIDEFCTFKWNDLDSWDEFGAFIIADKRGDLKASSGPSFTNNYSKPQFESAAGQLQGITFNTKQISFKVGIYWASMADYRKFLNWLHPYEVADLQFGYDKDYAYFCKLAKIDDANKYVVGHQGDEAMYYFETNLTFELQGEACAHSKESYNWSEEYSIQNNSQELNNSEHVEWDDWYKIEYSKMRCRDELKINSSWKPVLNHLGQTSLGNSELSTDLKINFHAPGIGTRNLEQTVTISVNEVVMNKELQAPTSIIGIENFEWGSSLDIHFFSNNKEFTEITFKYITKNKITKITKILYNTVKVYDVELSGWVNDIWRTIYIAEDVYETNSFFNDNCSISPNKEIATYKINACKDIIVDAIVNSLIGILKYNDYINTMFQVDFKSNVTLNSFNQWYFSYDSRQGLLYWGTNDNLIPINYFLLWENKKCIDKFVINPIIIPGSLEYNLDYKNLELTINFNMKDYIQLTSFNVGINEFQFNISSGDNDLVLLQKVKNKFSVPQSFPTIRLETNLSVPSKVDITMYAKKNII